MHYLKSMVDGIIQITMNKLMKYAHQSLHQYHLIIFYYRPNQLSIKSKHSAIKLSLACQCRSKWLVLKTTGNKKSLITLKRTIRASVNLIDPLTSDRMNTWRTWHKITYASLLKSSNLLSHHVLSFRMKNNIMIKGWLKKSSDYKSRRRVIVKGRRRQCLRLISCSREESVREEGSTGGEDDTSSIKQEDDTSEKSSSEKAGASDKRAP
jgi:hypothetical protein